MPDHAEEDELTLIENAPPSRPDARLGVPATARTLRPRSSALGALGARRRVAASARDDVSLSGHGSPSWCDVI